MLSTPALDGLLSTIEKLDREATPSPWDNDAPGCVGRKFSTGGKTTVATTGYRLSGNGAIDATLIATYRTISPNLVCIIRAAVNALQKTGQVVILREMEEIAKKVTC